MNHDMFSSTIIGAVSIAAGIAIWRFLTTVVFKKQIKSLEGTKLGVNLSEAKCPNCGNPFPRVRTPKNFRQAMWGGWTCEKCGTEFDKWLKPIEPKK